MPTLIDLSYRHYLKKKIASSPEHSINQSDSIFIMQKITSFSYKNSRSAVNQMHKLVQLEVKAFFWFLNSIGSGLTKSNIKKCIQCNC